MASLELLEGRMQYAPTAYRQEALFLMVDWWGSKNVTGKTCFLGSSFLPLMEEKKQKKIKASETPAIFCRVPR